MKIIKKALAIVLTLAMMAGSISVMTGCGGSTNSIDLSSFTAEDMDGNEVTQDIFKDHDVTMVNIWASWCQFCVEEMPALEELHQQLAPNTNIIGICMDAADERDTVVQEIKDTGVTYTIIVGNDELDDLISSNVTGYPTTFYIGSDGKVIDGVDPVVGAPAEKKKEIIAAYQDKFQEALDAIGAE